MDDVLVPTWTGSRLKVCKRAFDDRSTDESAWIVEAAASFDLTTLTVRPRFLLTPATERPISSSAVGRALHDPALRGKLLASGSSRSPTGPKDQPSKPIELSDQMRVPSPEGIGFELHDAAALDAWSRFAALRASELGSEPPERMHVPVTRWRTTVPWALLVPSVARELAQRFGVPTDLSGPELGVELLRRVPRSRGRPPHVPATSLPLNLLHLVRRRRDIRRGVGIGEALGRLDPRFGGTRLDGIKVADSLHADLLEDLVVEPILLPSDGAEPLPLALLAACVGREWGELRHEDLVRILVAPAMRSMPREHYPWPEWLRLPDEHQDAVVAVLVPFVEQVLTRWLERPEAANTLRVIAGNQVCLTELWEPRGLAVAVADLRVLSEEEKKRARQRECEEGSSQE